MRVRRDKTKFSVASLLLCLLAAFAISSPEAVCRTNQAGNRNRTARTVRFDDHDHDHSLEALQTGLDFMASSVGDGGTTAAILPSSTVFPGNGGPPGDLLLSPKSQPATAVISILRGRAPPVA